MNRALFAAAAGLLILGLAHGTLGLGARLLGQPEPSIVVTQVVIGVVAFGLGLANSFITVPAQTVLQEHAPPAIRARVFSAFYTISNAILIVPLLLAGGLTDLIGVVQTIVLISVLVFLVALVGQRLAAGAAGPEPVPVAGGATGAEE